MSGHVTRNHRETLSVLDATDSPMYLEGDLTTGALYVVGSGTFHTDEAPYAIKTTSGSNVVYIGEAAPGSAQASAVWRCQKIDYTTGSPVVTWADGDGNFNNVATDLTALTYS